MIERKHARPRCLLHGLALITASALQAQQTPRSSDTPEETLLLSPFTVQTERDTGYRATSTLAGSRLNTPLKDIGASVSVVTKDLLDDLGATSLNDVLIYTGNTEAAGAGGNFSGAVDYGNAQTIGFGDRASPQDQSRARGLSAPTRTRNYFITALPADSYNIESVTVVRGPNSVLFGAGSPSGVVESSLLKADVNRNRTKLEARFGNNGSERQLIDHNQVVLDGKLAGRVALLRHREKYNQEPAFEDKDRVYGTFTYAPFRSTSLRVSAEYGEHVANRPITTLPFNSIPEAWFRDGRPFADWRFHDDPALNPAAAQQGGGSRDATGRPLPFNAAGWISQFQAFSQAVLAYPTSFAPAIAGGFGAQTSTVAGFPALPAAFNRDNAADNLNWVTTGNVGEVSDNRDFIRTGLPEFAAGRPAGLVFQGYTDYSQFDFQNRMIDEMSRFFEDFKSVNVAFEQRAWEDRVGVQLEYDWQNYERLNRALFFSGDNQNHIRLDATRWLPNGNPNPNFGRPFVQGGTNPHLNRQIRDQETFRATAYLKYDFTELNESVGKWLGSHTLTGLWDQYTNKQVNYQKAFFLSGEPSYNLTAATNYNNFNRRPVIIKYIGPSVYDVGSVQLSPIQGQFPNDLDSFPITYYDRRNQEIVTRAGTLNELLHGGSMNQERITATAGVLQSYLLDNHLVSLIGIRRDKPEFGGRNLVTAAADTTVTLEEQMNAFRRDLSLNDITTPLADRLAATTKTYSFVLRWPQKLLRLPAGADLNVFYNQSENFSPSGATRDVFLNVLPSPTGETEEYGFYLGLFDDKLSFRVNKYTTESQNINRSSDIMATAVNNAFFQRASTWLGDVRTDREADVNRLLAAAPDLVQLYGWAVTINPTTGGRAGTTTINPTINRGDTADVVAEGYEFELTYNPTRNWRITANAAQQETVQSNLLPRTKALIERFRPVWNSLGGVPAEAFATADQPPAFAGESFASWINRTVYVPFAQAIALENTRSPEQREWRVNLVTNYTFSRDSLLPVLKGFNVGSGLRWQSKAAVGYPVSVSSTGAINVDVARPYYDEAQLNVDAWIGYRRKIFNDRIEWRVQLNASNITTDDDPILVRAQPWGAAAIVRLPPERRYYLTNTFTF